MILLDTSGLLCLHHRAELQHDRARTFFEAETDKLTHGYVLAEFVALAQARGLPRGPALAFVDGLLANPEVEVIWVDEFLNRLALDMLQRQLDKTYSLCDAVCFVLMAQYGLTEALTTDRHFAQAGFRPLLVDL